MELVITPRLTLTDDLPYASHGAPVGVLVIDAAKIVVFARTAIELEDSWTTPEMIVLQWLYENTATPEQKVFACKFINPAFTPPAP